MTVTASDRPAVLDAIGPDTEALGFTMSCEEPVRDLGSRPGWARLPLLDWSCGVLVMVRV